MSESSQSDPNRPGFMVLVRIGLVFLVPVLLALGVRFMFF